VLDAVARLDARYRDAKSRAGRLDFSDLEEKPQRITATLPAREKPGAPSPYS
jgi:ATP-dependent exoDNAse (exonuclease V) beta subunit